MSAFLLIQSEAFQCCTVGPLPYCSGNSSSDLLSLQRAPPPWKDHYSALWLHKQQQPSETGLLPSTRTRAERWQRGGGTAFEDKRENQTGRWQVESFCKMPVFASCVVDRFHLCSSHLPSCLRSWKWQYCSPSWLGAVLKTLSST